MGSGLFDAYPKLNIILGHMGVSEYVKQAVAVARQNDNIYLETSVVGWMPLLLEAFRGVLEGVRGAARGMWDALDEAGKLDDLSAQTGLAAQSLSVLRTAFHLAGMAADDVQPVVNKMQRAIADAAAGNAGAVGTVVSVGNSCARYCACVRCC